MKVYAQPVHKDGLFCGICCSSQWHYAVLLFCPALAGLSLFPGTRAGPESRVRLLPATSAELVLAPPRPLPVCFSMLQGIGGWLGWCRLCFVVYSTVCCSSRGNPGTGSDYPEL